MPPSQYEERVLRSLRRIVRATALYNRSLMASHRLTTPQLVCLRRLAKGGPCTTGQLSADVYLSGATVTGILDRLEDRGLITRQRAKPDRRKVTVSLTEAGKKVVREAPAPLQSGLALKLAGLAESEQAEIDRVLFKVVEMMEAQDLDAAPLITPEAELAGPDDPTELG